MKCVSEHIPVDTWPAVPWALPHLELAVFQANPVRIGPSFLWPEGLAPLLCYRAAGTALVFCLPWAKRGNPCSATPPVLPAHQGPSKWPSGPANVPGGTQGSFGSLWPTCLSVAPLALTPIWSAPTELPPVQLMTAKVGQAGRQPEGRVYTAL